MTDKNQVQHFITYFGNDKLSDTKPELALDRFAEFYMIECDHTDLVTFYDEDGDRWDVTPDRLIRIDKAEPFYCHADGPHHWTPKFRAKDDWQDGQLNKLGKKVLRIDSPVLLDEAFWPGLWKQMAAFAYDPKVRKLRIYA